MNLDRLKSATRRARAACVGLRNVCSGANARLQEQGPMVAVSVTGYNHMPDAGWYLAGFSVNGASGPNLQPETGGGGFNCCISIPQRWKPGMKAKVEWVYSVGVGDTRTPPPPHEAEVDIPDYSAVGPGTVNVHFYPDHRVKVIVSRFAIEHPRHALSEEEKRPWRTDLSLLSHSSMRD